MCTCYYTFTHKAKDVRLVSIQTTWSYQNCKARLLEENVYFTLTLFHFQIYRNTSFDFNILVKVHEKGEICTVLFDRTLTLSCTTVTAWILIILGLICKLYISYQRSLLLIKDWGFSEVLLRVLYDSVTTYRLTCRVWIKEKLRTFDKEGVVEDSLTVSISWHL